VARYHTSHLTALGGLIKTFIAALVIAGCLAGCATPNQSATGPKSVTIHLEAGAEMRKGSRESEAQSLAEAQCSVHDRHAKLSSESRMLGNYTYDCVEFRD